MAKRSKEILREKEFANKENLIEWANSSDGTDYIISITVSYKNITISPLIPQKTVEVWTLFYIK